MMRALHCSWAIALLLPAALGAQAPGSTAAAAPQAQRATSYTIFVRGAPIGREEITVETGAAGTTVVSSGRLSPPLNVVLRRAEFKYTPDWTPQSVALDISTNGGDTTVRTTFAGGAASTEIMQQGKPGKAMHQVSPQTLPLPNNVFAAYAAVAQRLTGASVGTELRAYVIPAAEVTVRVSAVTTDRMQIGASFFTIRRYELTVANPDGDLKMTLSADERGQLVRLNIPAGGLDVVREDVAASTSRVELHTNPGDEPVIIPAVGFNLGATLTRPKNAPPAPARLPAVVLLTGSGVADRDGNVAGIPTLGQLAGAIADAGFLAVRYDKRGFGQSGGRAESATLQDYSEDTRAVVKWLRDRKDVDPKRIAVVGHSEGAWVALAAAARENRITALVSIAGPASTGNDVILEQQQRALDSMKLTDAARGERVALQKQIQTAVLTGKGWEGVPPELRKQADTPWLQSFLAFDPAKVIDDVRQPMLFVHGELDRQVPVAHVTKLSEMARQGRSRSVEVVVVRGVNHLLVPATTGEVSEYASLPDRNVSTDVRNAVTGWLTRTFAAIK